MKFTETDVADYIMARKPFPSELLECLHQNYNNYGSYFPVDTRKVDNYSISRFTVPLSDDNKLLAEYIKIALKQGTEVLIPKIIAACGALEFETPVFNSREPTPLPLQAVGSAIKRLLVRVATLNKGLDLQVLARNVFSVLSKDTDLEDKSFFNERSLTHIENQVISILLNEQIGKDTNFIPSYRKTGGGEESTFLDRLTIYLQKQNAYITDDTQPYSFSGGPLRDIEDSLIESVRSETSIFLLDRIVIKAFLDKYDITSQVWDLLYKLEPRVKGIRDTCELLSFSDEQTKEYMRNCLVDIPMDMTADLSELTL